MVTGRRGRFSYVSLVCVVSGVCNVSEVVGLVSGGLILVMLMVSLIFVVLWSCARGWCCFVASPVCCGVIVMATTGLGLGRFERLLLQATSIFSSFFIF